MARVPIIEPSDIDNPEMAGIFAWVIDMEGSIPNHFKVELNFPEFFIAKLSATKILWETGELSISEIQKIGILVSQANGCAYCTAAFCTIWNFGLGATRKEIEALLSQGSGYCESARESVMLNYALKVNTDATSITDNDIDQLRDAGFGDKGIVQITHLVSDFASYNRLNLALDTEYDYDILWKTLGGF
ncbi:MAG TPA: carboxymuconolactone decarboxylase family protein [Gammaproteobacteria bacterium]|nr:carboxymuconolactone decarboxylase family protein [Gammaproteobacteria bacterium]MDP7271953.1 carboxymuconolactone decarboxylase family protein [Gammaproteobacteria bacterium]HJP38305.1 carboxymuconolactone decarboxylase family protein [Gammaproteobacteria bacterium]